MAHKEHDFQLHISRFDFFTKTLTFDMCKLGWSEKPKSWKSKNGQADYLPRHSPDVRTVFEIKIRPLVFCEIGQMRFTEKGINFKKPRRRHFTEKSPNFMKPSQI